MSVFPLNIPDKEDHIDKTAKLQNVDPKYYETAEEINKKRDAIIENYNAIVAITKGTGAAFATRALAMAEDPLPADDTPFVVYGETGHVGQYRYASGEVDGYVLMQSFYNVLAAFDKTNNIDGATMKAIDDYYQPKITEVSDKANANENTIGTYTDPDGQGDLSSDVVELYSRASTAQSTANTAKILATLSL